MSMITGFGGGPDAFLREPRGTTHSRVIPRLGETVQVSDNAGFIVLP